MKNKIICFLVGILVFICSGNVFALSYGGCEYSEISRLKSFVSNINISYDYYIENNNAFFNITINNITPGMYFVDSKTRNTYTYNNTIDGEITLYGYAYAGGKLSFYSALDACYGISLGNKYYNFPIYNDYYMDPLCEENRNFTLCQKWANVNYSYSEFKKIIDKYNKQENEKKDNNIEIVYEKTFLDAIVKFYTKYYYYILISIIVVCVVIMIINNKKNKFDI